MQIVPKNPIEAKHLEALYKFGHNPEDWTFEKQLPYFRRLSVDLLANAEQQIEKYSAWSPSRFEHIELIPLYSFASEHIQIMQEMSGDNINLPPTAFLIASDPARTVQAFVEEHGSAISTENIEGSFRHVVWINVGLVNLLKALSHHFVSALIGGTGDLVGMFDELTKLIDVRGGFNHLVARLRVRRFQDDPLSDSILNSKYSDPSSGDAAWLVPSFGKLEELDPRVREQITVLMMGLITFIAGHEMGHIYLGHTGFHERKRMITGSSNLSEYGSIDSEIEADMVGLLSVWDGMANQRDGSVVSIDYTWVAPVFFLSTMIALSLSISEENANKWTLRLFFLMKGLLTNLRRTGFETERIQRIKASAPLIAGATVEWIWHERIHAIPAGESPGWFLVQELTKVCSQA